MLGRGMGIDAPTREADFAAITGACRRYLVSTRSAPPELYDVVEAAAWFELLRALERSGRPLDRSCVREAAAA